MAEWIPLLAAVVAALATVAVQILISRGEPVGLRRVRALTAAIEAMPKSDEGRVELEAARTAIAKRASRALIGPSAIVRSLRNTAWVALAGGLVTIVFATLIALYWPNADQQREFATAGYIVGLVALSMSPVLLVYAWAFSQFPPPTVAEIRETIEAYRNMRARQRAAKAAAPTESAEGPAETP